jgi:predicted nuclease of predicted toxin-antitoxin system
VKFLIDNQLPPLLATWFTSRGHEAFHVLDVKLAQAKDHEIWNYAEIEGLILLQRIMISPNGLLFQARA